jgi:hypothetical protein
MKVAEPGAVALDFISISTTILSPMSSSAADPATDHLIAVPDGCISASL